MKKMGSDRKVTLCCCKNKYAKRAKKPRKTRVLICTLRIYRVFLLSLKRERKEKMKKSVKETVREAILPTVTELGYRLWDVTYAKVGADYHLEITIDNDEGININDCEKVHRAIDPIIDECDPIEGFYYLDVSSPGAERDLRTDEHIRYCIGWRVEAKLFSQKDGRKSFVGTLVSYEDSTVSIKEGDEVVALGRDEISKLTTVYTEA